LSKVSDSQDLLTRFLLDEMEEPERATVEDRLLSDPEFYEQMLVAEGDLTDAYVRGDLSAGERARFEKSFLSSARRRERVEFARGLANSATQLHREEFAKPRSDLTPALSTSRGGWLASLFGSRPVLNYALAGAALVVMGVTVWFAIERMRARVQTPEPTASAPQIPERNDGGVAERQGKDGTPSLPPRDGVTPGVTPTPERDVLATRPVFATITLMPGALRDGTAGANLFVPRVATHVRVRLQLEEDHYRSYQAVVSTPEGRKIWAGSTRKDRENNAQFVSLIVPATLLARGDYVVELNGIAAAGQSEPAAQYSFRVSQNRLR
jgi:hypothetical protein